MVTFFLATYKNIQQYKNNNKTMYKIIRNKNKIIEIILK